MVVGEGAFEKADITLTQHWQLQIPTRVVIYPMQSIFLMDRGYVSRRFTRIPPSLEFGEYLRFQEWENIQFVASLL